MKGKPWTVEMEKQLRQLVGEDKSIEVIAKVLGKSVDAVYLKCRRLSLLVEEDAKGYTTSSLKLPKDLPSVEEALRILAGALQAAAKPGLNKVEVQRLQVVATLARAYKDILADYFDYRGVEAQLLELRRKYEQLAKKAQSDAKK
jgi:hypothetical protein